MPSPKPKRCGNAISEQKELLAEFMKSHPQLISSKFSATFSFKDAQKLWQEAADILNAVSGGGHKTWIQWRKTWQDLQSRTKKKGAEIIKVRNKTGGGGDDEVPVFKPEEEAVFDLISKASIEGHEVAETSINFDTEDETEVQGGESGEINIIRISENEQVTASPLVEDSNVRSRRKRKSSARAMEDTISHAHYLGSIQKDYLSDKKQYNAEIINIKKQKVEALERSAAAQEKIAAAFENITAALVQIAAALS